MDKHLPECMLGDIVDPIFKQGSQHLVMPQAALEVQQYISDHVVVASNSVKEEMPVVMTEHILVASKEETPVAEASSIIDIQSIEQFERIGRK